MSLDMLQRRARTPDSRPRDGTNGFQLFARTTKDS